MKQNINGWKKAVKNTYSFGKLRIFSYYFDAAQFGASQGHLAIVCIILATGPYKLLKKAWFAIAGLLIFYGMLISGTREHFCNCWWWIDVFNID